MTPIFFLVNDDVKRRACAAIMSAPEDYYVEIKQKKRSIRQNAAMWLFLGVVSKCVDWYGEKLTAEEWKDVFTAAIKRQKTVNGMDGGFVVLGARTSAMSKPEMTELIELIVSFSAQQGITLPGMDYGD